MLIIKPYVNYEALTVVVLPVDGDGRKLLLPPWVRG
jgi:hypothetical protein